MKNRISTGMKNKSPNKALNKVTLIKMPTVILGGWTENSKTMKPKIKITVVKQIAFPDSKKVISIESSIFKPLFLASLNLLKKWIVSSTAIPKIIAKTIEIPASNSIPKKPKTAPANNNGIKFGIIEMITFSNFWIIKPSKY